MTLRNKWKTRQLDYVLAFPQAPVERELYMQIPKGIRVKGTTEYALKVDRTSMDRSKPVEYGISTLYENW